MSCVMCCRFGRWAAQEESKELTDADIVFKLSRATGLTNEILLHNITQKMRGVAPSAVYALSKFDATGIQQLTVVGENPSFLDLLELCGRLVCVTASRLQKSNCCNNRKHLLVPTSHLKMYVFFSMCWHFSTQKMGRALFMRAYFCLGGYGRSTTVSTNKHEITRSFVHCFQISVHFFSGLCTHFDLADSTLL